MPEIDPTIPLQTKVPGGRTLRDAYDRQRQLKIMSLQGQQAQLNIERLQRQREEAEEKLKGQRIQNELMKQYTFIGPDGIATTNHQAIQNGLIQKGYPDIATTYELGINQANSARQKADTDTLQTGMAKTKALGDLLGSCINAPEGDKRAECYRRGIAAAKGMGIGEQYPNEYTSDMLPDLESFYRMAVTVQGDTAAYLQKREKEQIKIEQRNKEERAKGMGILAQWEKQKKTNRLARSIWDPNATDADGNPAPIDNSAAYHSLTGEQKAELVPMLTKLGFTNWSKQATPPVAKPTSEKDVAKAEYTYQTRIKKHNDDEAQELEALREILTSDYHPPDRLGIQRLHNQSDEIRKKYNALREAAFQEMKASGGGEHKVSEGIKTYNEATGDFQ